MSITINKTIRRIEVSDQSGESVTVTKVKKTVQVNSSISVSDIYVTYGDIIDLKFNKLYSTYYPEYTYSAGDLTNIDVWDTVAKTTKLYEQVLTYTSGNLSKSVVTDLINSKTKTQDFVYDGSGNLINAPKTYT